MSEFDNNSHFASSDGFNLNELPGIEGKSFELNNNTIIKVQ